MVHIKTDDGVERKRRSTSVLRFLKKALIPTGLVAISILSVGINVARHQQLSPIDEYVYLDYVARVFDDGPVRMGEMTGNVARSYISCEGVAGYGVSNPSACTSQDFSENANYPYGGKTSADIYTPAYFVVAAAFGKSFSSIFGTDILFGARMTGALWLALATLLLYWTMRKLSFSVWLSLIPPALLIGSISTWWSNTFISTDATSTFAGALLLAALINFYRRPNFWILPVASVFVTLLKFQNLMAVVLSVLVILIFGLRNTSPTNFRNAAIPSKKLVSAVALLSVIGSVLSELIWMTVRKSIAVGTLADQGVATPLGWRSLVAESTKFLDGLTHGVPGFPPQNSIVLASQSALLWLVIGGAFAATVVQERGALLRISSHVWLLIMLIAGPALAIANQFASGFYFSLPSRYALSLLPMGLVLIPGGLASNRIWRVVLYTFAVASLALPFIAGQPF